MAATYEPIASVTLASAAPSVTFSSIPQGFQDIVVRCFALSARVTPVSGFVFRFNSDSATNYSTTRIGGSGSSAFSDRQTSTALPAVQVAGTTFGNFTPISLQLMSYSSTNVYKTGLINSDVVQNLVTRGVLLWRSTAAVTSITLLEEAAGNFAVGSTFSLYGIQAA